ncbi:ATP-binding protein, partial [Dactylosporangium salmoneum]|uniref:ATP-binding protein n=1 Tax=Dactylosporangium salmoneum TaxID=53361 RepID=UPI0031CDD039
PAPPGPPAPPAPPAPPGPPAPAEPPAPPEPPAPAELSALLEPVAAVLRAVPRELPADVAGFTGRRAAVAELDRLLDRPGGGVRIVSLSGTPGVGKTALAVHWAHRVAERFPDGQLFADLRGYDPGAPVTPAEALGGFLRSLGEPGGALPTAVPELAARYRTLMAGRRTLVVLDNAGSVEQVRDLLPGAASSVVLVTSRDALPGLVARHGAVRVELDLLTSGEATALLTALIGPRAGDGPDDLRALAARCAYLPLALRIAAELAVSRPAATLAELTAELAEQRLDALAAGDDGATAVRTVFSWSIRQLSPSGRRLFDLLGLYPGQDLDAAAAAALCGTTVPAARQELATLHRAHLVDGGPGGRYGMHDLLRAYAAERAAGLPAAERDGALEGLRAYHREAATSAVRRKFAATPAAAEAGAWLDAERFNLLALAGEPTTHAMAMSAILGPYLDACGHYADAIALHTLAASAASAASAAWGASADPAASGPSAASGASAVWAASGPSAASGASAVWAASGPSAASAASGAPAAFGGSGASAAFGASGGSDVSAAGDPAAAGAALNRLGAVHARSGDLTAAVDRYAEALASCERAGDPAGAATALHGIAVARFRTGRYPEALDAAAEALSRYRGAGDELGAGEALKSMALTHLQLGDYATAIEYLHQALALHRSAGDRTNEGRSLNNLGFLHYRLGHDIEAQRYFEQGAAIARELGNRAGEAVALINLSHLDARQARVKEAHAGYREAVDLCAEIGYRVGQAEALRGLGVAARRLGRLADAFEHLTEALTLSRRLRDPDMEAGALDDLGFTLRAAGRLSDALRRHTAAHTIATASGDPFAQARALSGLAEVLAAAGQPAAAAEHRARAEALYGRLGVPEHARELS